MGFRVVFVVAVYVCLLLAPGVPASAQQSVFEDEIAVTATGSVDGVADSADALGGGIDDRERVLAILNVDRLWSSPSRRCHDLACFLARREDLPVTVDERLHELSFGRWEGRRWDDLPRSELAAWGDSWQVASPPGGETVAELGARVGTWQTELSPRERHLLVAHAGVVRALWVLCEGRTWTGAMATTVPFLKPLAIEAKESP